MRTLVTSVALALLAALPLAAQSGDDIMFSEDDRGFRTHPGMFVQVADSHAGATLVAWGSTTFDSAGSVMLTLYVQQVRGRDVVGSPHRLGGDVVRLSHELAVVPLDGDFLVIYKAYPYNAAGGTMSQFYDARADTLGPPYFLTTLGIPLDETLTFRTPPYAMRSGADHWRIFWRAEEFMGREFFTAELDRAGRPLSPTVHSSPTQTTPLTYRDHEDFVLFYSPFDDGYPLGERPRVYRPSRGAFDPRTLPFLFNSFHIGADTSVVVYRDSTILYYPSLFDTSRHTERTIDLKRWGIGVTLSRDAAGRIHLYVPAGRKGGYPYGNPAVWFIVDISIDRIDAPAAIDTLFTVVDTGGAGRLGPTRSTFDHHFRCLARSDRSRMAQEISVHQRRLPLAHCGIPER